MSGGLARARSLRYLPLLVVCLAGSPYRVAAQSGPPSPPMLPDEAAARRYFTDTTLLTQDGERRRFFSDVLKDHVVVINAFYTSCQGLSPRQGQVLTRLQEMLGEKLGREVFIVSITVDPKNDGVEALGKYARERSARPGWLFLTGDPESVGRVNHKLGQFVEHPADHHGLYLLGNVKTGLWMKLPLHAMPTDLYLHVQRLLQDPGEPPPGE